MTPPTLIRCAKLNQDLPAIDPNAPEQARALKVVLLVAGSDLMKRVREQVSAQALAMWGDHMRMVINEYRLDPTSDEAARILRPHLEAFFFGQQKAIDNYVPPK